MGVKIQASEFGPFFGRPGSIARKTWDRFVHNEQLDSSLDREELRQMVLKIGLKSPLGAELNRRFNLGLR